MTISQNINHINDNNYDVDITITDIPEGWFGAVTDNSIGQGANTREIRVDLMPLQQHPGGTMTVNSGFLVRQAGETAVSVTVSQEGKTLGTNTKNY